MLGSSDIRLQLIVFALVAASFTNIYLAQPVLPVVQAEFGVEVVWASFAVSAVILGIALSNLPFGLLVDHVSIKPIILAGGIVVSVAGLVCAYTNNFGVLITARFFQGLFIPALTTCLAAYLAKTLPIEKLSVVMGSYVSATVLGGLGGRLMGGWLHPPLHWRYAFFTTAILTLLTTIVAVKWLPQERKLVAQSSAPIGYVQLLKQWQFLRYFFCAAGSFAVFSSVFNYLPYRLATEPFNLSTEATTALYLVYIMGIFMGPIAGRISSRFGSGFTLVAGSVVLFLSVLLLFFDSIVTVVIALMALCTGFFCVHAAAVGALNRQLVQGHGRANALYVLFYYVGGWLGITVNGLVYQQVGWWMLVLVTMVLVLIPLSVGFTELKNNNRVIQ